MAKLGPHLAKLTQVSMNRWPGSGPGLRHHGLESALSRQIELAGKSGARYRYTPMQEERFLPPAGANFVIAKLGKDGGTTLLYAGETDNLANQTWRQALEKARETERDAAILTRLNVTRAVRKAEQDDLVEEYHPPMNDENRV